MRTRLADSISRVSYDVPSVLELYKEIADGYAAADTKEDVQGTKDFTSYGHELYAQTIAFSPAAKKDIKKGLVAMQQQFADDKKFPEAFFLHDMNQLIPSA